MHSIKRHLSLAENLGGERNIVNDCPSYVQCSDCYINHSFASYNAVINYYHH